MNRKQRRTAAKITTPRRGPAVNHVPAAGFAAAVAAFNRNDLGDAGRICEKILAHDPGVVDALSMLGVVHSLLGREREAVEVLEQAVRLAPEHADLAYNLGLAKSKRGDMEGAAAAFQRAIQLKPSAVAAYQQLSRALQERNRHGEAIAVLKQGLAVAPDDARLHSALGALLLITEEAKAAEHSLRTALGYAPADVKAWTNLGVALQEQNRHDEAKQAFERALAIDPQDADALNDLSRSLLWAGDFAGSERLLHRAIALRPDSAEFANALGVLNTRMGQPDRAGSAFRTALRLDPSFATAAYNLALALLMKGDYTQGFALYEERWRTKAFANTSRSWHRPRWSGQAFKGKRLLLHAEQGIGDSIQMLRYLAIVAARGGPVLLEIQQPLMRLLEGNPHIARMWSRHDPPASDFDLQLPLFSLPRTFGTTLDRVPATVPYIGVPPAQIARAAAQLGRHDRARIALVWAGNAEHYNDRNRSIPLKAFEPLLEVPGVEFVSLQYGEAAGQIVACGYQHRVRDLSELQRDLLDTGAILHNVDLLVCVDTAVLHLAGALARPVWGLIAKVQDFRWMLERDDSPWYPTLKLFRQQQHGDWGPVIERVKEELTGWLERTWGHQSTQGRAGRRNEVFGGNSHG